MKIKTTKKDLTSALNNSIRAVPSKASIPILSNLKLVAGDNCCFQGFDLSIGIESKIAADVMESGSVCIPAKIFSEIINKLADGDISIESNEDDKILIKSKSGKYNIIGIDVTEYPEFPIANPDNTIAISNDVLNTGINYTIGAAAADETKQILTGINIECKDKLLSFAATDGHRLSVVNIPDIDGDFNLTIPSKTLGIVQKIISKSENVNIQFSESELTIITDESTVFSRILTGSYPDYRKLLPASFSRKVTLNRKDAIDAIELIQLLAPTIVVNISDSEFQIAAESNLGSGTRLVDCQLTGKTIEIAFNAKYLIEGLKTMSTQEIEIHLNEPLQPVVLKPVGGDIDLIYLVMPLQLRK